MRYLMWEWDRVSFFLTFRLINTVQLQHPIQERMFLNKTLSTEQSSIIHHPSFKKNVAFAIYKCYCFFLARSITLPLTIFSPIQVKAQLSFATERSSFSSLVTTEIRLSWFKRPCYMKHVSCQSTKTQVWNKWAAQLFLSKPSFVFLL